jgi:hypothetical protein
MIYGGWASALILAVFEEDWLGARMRGQEADEFGAAIATESDDANLIFIHRYE